MKPLRIFISSVQSEFADERQVLHEWLCNDPLMRRFYEPFLFEHVPARDRRADEIYLDEVASCDVYIGLFGDDYGYEDADGVSPTEHEFVKATEQHKTRLIFVRGSDDKNRHPNMQALIRRIGQELIRRRYATTSELIGSVYAALVQDLEVRDLLRSGPFDASLCRKATLVDLDEEHMTTFLRHARRARGFPLAESATPLELLTHLNLMYSEHVTHAAVLLFAKKPQRFQSGSLNVHILVNTHN